MEFRLESTQLLLQTKFGFELGATVPLAKALPQLVVVLFLFVRVEAVLGDDAYLVYIITVSRQGCLYRFIRPGIRITRFSRAEAFLEVVQVHVRSIEILMLLVLRSLFYPVLDNLHHLFRHSKFFPLAFVVQIVATI